MSFLKNVVDCEFQRHLDDYDHVGTTAKLESSKLIKLKITEITDTSSVILLGDFNVNESSPVLFPFTDLNFARQVSIKGSSGRDHTHVSGRMIDHVFISQDLSVFSYHIEDLRNPE